MRAHHEGHLDEGDLRPRAARLDEPESEVRVRAALSGRLAADSLVRLQRMAGNDATSGLLDEERSPVHDVVSTGGSPLDTGVRADMEARLGHDFGDVRVHTDDQAHESARSVNAHAYTVGSHIVFQRSRYDPGSQEGQTMLAHELTHVVQQRSGPVDGTPAAGGIRVSDPSDRFEREAAATAEQAMAEPAVAAAPAMLQRQEAEEEPESESVQGAFVQRAEDEEAEEEPAE